MLNSYFFKGSLFCLFMLLFTSCEKEVSYKFKNDAPPKVVIEGQIENDQVPRVQISRSMSFLGIFDFEDVENFFIHDAIVEVSDGDRTITLKEYQTPPTEDFPSFYIYTVDTNNIEDFSFVGEMGKTYHLKVTIGDELYEASTSIPHPKPFDSLWIQKPSPDFSFDNIDSLREIYVRYDDPDTLGNNFRIATSINGGPFLNPMASVFSDELANGSTVEIGIMPGVIPGDTASFEKRMFFQLGDEVIVKWSAIDNQAYNFINTLEYSILTTGNPFAAPIKVTSNIKGKNVLGAWIGYGNSFHSILVKDLEP